MLMSAGEFKRFIHKTVFEKIIFSTADSASSVSNMLPVSFGLEFDSLYVDISPPAVCLNGSCGDLSFDFVKQIDVSKEEDFLCAELTCVSCGTDYRFKIILQ